MLARVGRRYPATQPGGVTLLRPRAQVYEGAGTGRRARGWRAPTVGANDGVLGSLATLRDRSRAAIRNDGWARGAIDRLVTNIVGSGIKPLAKATDPEFRAALQALWLTWTDFSDADGLLDWYGQQAQAVRCWLEAGEVFVRLRARLPEDGLPVPLQVQLIEPEFCPHTHNGTNGGNRIRAGIEFSPIGQRAAYWMYRQRPGDLQDMDVTQLVRVPADAVIHLFDPVRPGQIRGIPQLTQALVKITDLNRFDDATLIRQQLSNLFVGFLKRPAGVGDADVDPLTGKLISTTDDQAMVALEPGIWQELAPGEDVAFSDPPDIGNTYEMFMRQQLLAVAAAADVPYEILTGDLTKITDRTVRIILNEFRRRIQQRQHHIVAYQFCRPVWTRWIAQAILAGALPVPTGYFEDPEPWQRVKWMAQGWDYIHPVQDVQAHREAVRAGFRSRSEVVSELGEDAEVIDRENAEDNARADALGLTYDSDARNDSSSSAASTEPPDREDGDGTPRRFPPMVSH